MNSKRSSLFSLLDILALSLLTFHSSLPRLALRLVRRSLGGVGSLGERGSGIPQPAFRLPRSDFHVRCHRQIDTEPRPLTRFALDSQHSTVILHVGVADEQPQAFADVARAGGFVFSCEEGFEDVLADIEGDAGAVVFNRNADCGLRSAEFRSRKLLASSVFRASAWAFPSSFRLPRLRG